MDKLYKRTNLLLNLAIVVVVILIGVVFARNYLRSVPAHRDYRGTKVNLSGIDWEKNQQTLLLVLDEKCRFCTESAPFYQRLIRENPKVTLVAVLPQDVATSRKYLLSLNVPIDEIRQSSLDALGVEGTPTLILVNGKGEVREAWAGKLPPEEETEVLKRIEE
jgi:thioredoxin-related protein